MMHSSFRCYFLLVFFLFLHTRSAASNVVVSPDDNVQDAIDNLLPGDTLLLSAGIYSGPYLVSINGTPESPIVIRSLSSDFDDLAVIDGGAENPGMDLQNHWLEFENSSWVVVQDIQFQNGWTDPIQVFNSSYLSLKKCDFAGGRRVIRARGSDTHHILVENCFWDQGGEYLWDINRWMNRDAWDEMHSGSLRFLNGSLFASEGTGGGHVIRGNTIQYAFNALRWRADQEMDKDIEIYENTIEYIRDNDFEPEDYAFNLFIHHNRSHNIHKTLSIDNVNGGNIYFFGNTVTTDLDGRARSIATGFYKIYGEDQNISRPLYIFNNSYFGTGRIHGGIEGRSIVNVVHMNNAFELTRREWALDQWNETLIYDFDCSNQPFPEVLTGNGQQSNGIVALPAYVDGANLDLRLMDGSPCVDAGTVISIPELNWEQSFTGSAPDIGAYEGNDPIIGPFFRVETSNTEEKPRLTLVSRDKDSTNLSFSTSLQGATVSGNIFQIDANGNQVAIADFVLKDNDNTVRFSNPSNSDNTYRLSNSLLGKNVQEATNWANQSQFELDNKDDLVTVLLYTPEGGTIETDQSRRILQRGTEVELTALANPGYRFVEWEGDVRGVQPNQSVTLNSSIWAIALFEEVPLSSTLSAIDVSIYPNPSDGIVHFDGGMVENLRVVGLFGQVVETHEEIVNGKLNLNHLTPGIYILSFFQNQEWVSGRLVIR